MNNTIQKATETQERTCPVCGKAYTEHPSLSRIDNQTLICHDCGTREALASIGVDTKEQEKILETISRGCKTVSGRQLCR